MISREEDRVRVLPGHPSFLHALTAASFVLILIPGAGCSSSPEKPVEEEAAPRESKEAPKGEASPVDPELAAIVAGWEKRWAEVRTLIYAEEADRKDRGLLIYEALRKEIALSGSRVSRSPLRARVQKIQRGMEEEWGAIKWVYMEREMGEAKAILEEMERSLDGSEFEEVFRLHNDELLPLTEAIRQRDAGYGDLCDDVIFEGEGLCSSATNGIEEKKIAAEVRSIGLEVLSIDPPEGEDAEWSVVILNRSEKAKTDPPPEGWKPEGRRYTVGSTIHQVEEMTIDRIETGKVVCIYKDAYEVDLHPE